MRWTSVKTRMPPNYTRLLVFGLPSAYGDREGGAQYVATYTNGFFRSIGGQIQVTHWKKLDPNPKLKSK